MTLKRLLYRLHKWIGLALGAFLIVQAVSGTLLVFKEEMRSSILSAGHSVEPQGARLPLDAIVTRAKVANPGVALDRVILPRTPDQAFIARYSASVGSRSFATIDPYSGRILRQGGYARFPLEAALFLHEELLLGDLGRWIIRISGLSLVLLATTGFILGWPGYERLRHALAVRFAGPYLALVYGLHRSIGLLAAMFLLTTAVTGCLIAWRPIIASAKVEPSIPVTLPTHEPLSLDAAARLLSRELANASVRDIRFPSWSADGVFFVFRSEDDLNPRAVHLTQVDLLTGRVTFFHPSSRRSPSAVALDWMLPVHTGEALRLFGRTLAFLTGLSLLALAATGVLVWIERRAIQSGKRRTKAGRA